MKRLSLFLFALLPLALFGADEKPKAARPETIVLDKTGVQNLRIQTTVIEPGDFEETVFALGRIEVYPGRRAVISSRISGRALEVNVLHDHPIKKGAPAIVIESRQPGNPPPQVTLEAPISGLVSVVSVVPGEPVSPDKALVEIIDLKEVYALARVPEHLAGKLKAGQNAHIVVSAAGGKTFASVLEHLGAQADAENGTVEAAFRIENPELLLRPGMRAEFSIVVSKRADVTSVPRAALQGTPSNRFVYVKDFDLPDAFVKTPVVVGQSNDRSVEIISGLLPSDEVVTQGAYSLAFAGKGTISLKEALDAAHGHAHNEDGSEVKGGAKPGSASAGANAGADGHGHAHADAHDDDHGAESGGVFWKLLSGVLFIALIVVCVVKKPAARAST